MKQYEAALVQAYADKEVSALEERLLRQLRERFGISDEEHDMLLAMVIARKKDEEDE